MPRRLIPPLMLLILAASSLPASAQAPSLRGEGTSPIDAPADTAVLIAHQLAAARVQSLALPNRAAGVTDVAVRIAGEDLTLRLRPYSVRAPGFRLMVEGADGELVAVAPPPISTVRGDIVGRPGSLVTGRLDNGRLTALVRTDPHSGLWGIQPLEGATHLIYDARDALDTSEGCGAPIHQGNPGDLASSQIPGISATPDSGPPPAPPETSAGSEEENVAQIACEADVKFFQRSGSTVQGTDADIESILNACESIYDAEASIRYEISALIVRTSEPAIYSANDAEALLVQFSNYWNNHHSYIPRDTAHLFTGKSLSGSFIGYAWFNSVCDIGRAYGMSESLWSGSYSKRVGLTAHELGHNWSADHCNGAPDCAIMCSTIGGCTGNLSQFGSDSEEAIVRFKDTIDCLSLPFDGGGGPGPGAGPPLIVDLNPRHGPSVGGILVTVSGDDFVDDPSTQVRVDGRIAPILDIRAPDSIDILLPAGTPGCLVDVQVSGPGGSGVLADGYTYEWTLNGGDRAQSAIAPGDTDRAYFDATAGSTFTATIKRGDKAADLAPVLRLLDPDGNEVALASDNAGKGKLKLSKVPLTMTGMHVLEISGVGASSGSYLLGTSLKPLRRVKSVFPIRPSSPTFDLDVGALRGSTASLQVKALKPKGDYALVEGQPADLQVKLVDVTGPPGSVTFDPESLSVVPSGKKLKLGVIDFSECGTYTFELTGNTDSIGWGSAQVKIKPPKLKKTTHVADPAMDQP